MTIQQLEAAKKLHDAIKENDRVLEHLMKYTTQDPDKIGILCNFFNECRNLHASIPKQELAANLYDTLIEIIKNRIDADRKALEAL